MQMSQLLPKSPHSKPNVSGSSKKALLQLKINCSNLYGGSGPEVINYPVNDAGNMAALCTSSAYVIGSVENRDLLKGPATSARFETFTSSASFRKC